MVTVFADGSINGHTSGEAPRCHYGWLALDNAGELIHYESGDMGINSAFSATSSEYEAIRAAMTWLADNWEIDYLRICSDSQVAIKQLKNEYNCHSQDLLPRLEAVEELEVYFVNVEYCWIPREKNTVADAISKCLQEKYGGRPLLRDEVLAIIALEGQKDD